MRRLAIAVGFAVVSVPAWAAGLLGGPGPNACYVWAPVPNISPYELAQVVPVLAYSASHQDLLGIGRAAVVKQVEALSPGARRNFRPCTAAERANNGG